MDERAVLDRIIGAATLADVAAAFTGSLEADPSYHWSAEVERKGHVVAITGTVFSGDEQVGRFARRLLYEKGLAHAIHEIFEIDDTHRRRGIATAHYRTCMRFYSRVGIALVSLEAAGMGPFVWPFFGFDLVKVVHRERLCALVKRRGIVPPDPPSPVAPEVVLMRDEGNPVGQRAMVELARLTQGSLPMALDLRDARQRVYLAARGILEAE